MSDDHIMSDMASSTEIHDTAESTEVLPLHHLEPEPSDRDHHVIDIDAEEKTPSIILDINNVQ